MILKLSIYFIFFYFFSILPQTKLHFDILENRFALIIGVSNYKDSTINLKYAAKDAQDIYNVLLQYGRFKNENIQLLIDTLATRERIRKGIEGWLQNIVKRDDLVFIYFSGHGSQGKDYSGDENDGFDEYLIPFDFDLTDMSTGISDDNFAYWIKNLASENVIIVLDCCYSGGAAKYKGFIPPSLKTSVVKIINDFNDEIPKKGTCLLAASQGDQTSQEDSNLKNGIFTYYFIEGISTNSDLNNNNIIDQNELYVYIKSKIDKRKQEPILINSLTSDLDLFFLGLDYKVVDSNLDELNHKISYLKRNRSYNRTTEENKQLLIWLEEKLKYNPSDISTINEIALLCEDLRNYKKAYYYYDFLYSLDKSEKWAMKLLEYSLKTGDCNRAKHILNKQEFGNKILSINNLAKVSLCSGDTLDAIEYLKKSLSIDKYDNREAFILLFYIYYMKSEFESAFHIIDRAVNLYFKDPEIVYWKAYFEKYYIKSAVADSLFNEYNKYTSNWIYVLDDFLSQIPNVTYDESIPEVNSTYFYKNEYFKNFYYHKKIHESMLLLAKKRKDINLFNESLKMYLKFNKLDIDSSLIIPPQ